MSITRSYNKHTGTYYAYETTYVWDESQQKKVQKKRCIGQYDPETDEIIPNGKRGRPRKEDASVKIVTTPVSATDADPNVTLISAITELSERLKIIETEYSVMADELHGLNNEISGLMKQISKR
jgi:hypothetical protein